MAGGGAGVSRGGRPFLHPPWGPEGRACAGEVSTVQVTRTLPIAAFPPPVPAELVLRKIWEVRRHYICDCVFDAVHVKSDG